MNFFRAIISILLSAYLCISYDTIAQTINLKPYKLYVHLDKAPFDSLYLHDYTEGRSILIPGKKIEEFTWEITIPIKIIKDFENMELLGISSDSKVYSKQIIRFKTERAGKNILVVNIGVENQNSYIYGTFIDTTVFYNESFLTVINHKDSLVIGDLICADFNLIIKDTNSDIAVRSQDPLFSWFVNANGEAISYNNHLESYVKLSKKHPNSRFLISNLAGNLTRYKSKEDVSKVYENFTDKHKSTIWAKHIEQFLSQKKFPNSILPTAYENISEKIIQDSSKYNLVIFTASWCLPCIEEIPILKKIYYDLGKNLKLTYISIDNEKEINPFKDLIKKKDILWRSLFAYQNINKIKQKYFIEGIPHSILVYPNQNMESLDVRKDKDLSKLYSVVNSTKSNN